MRRERESVAIIAAMPGCFTVYENKDEKDFEIDDAVIAWRVETSKKVDSDELYSECYPLTVDGEMASNCIGVQNPDLTITVFFDGTYKNINELRKQRYGEKDFNLNEDKA